MFGGASVHAESFERAVEAGRLSLGPRIQAFQTSMREPNILVPAPAMSSGVDDSITAGQRVFDPYYGAGRVKEVFPDGSANVAFDAWTGYINRDASNLAKRVGCLDVLCSGDRVFDAYYGAGRAVEIFRNGVARVAFDHWTGFMYRHFHSLGVGSGQSGGGFAVK